MFGGLLPAALVSELRATPAWENWEPVFADAYELADDPELRDLLAV